MSAIYNALLRLNESVGNLEKSADAPVRKIQALQQDKKGKGGKGQPDLFSAGQPAANRNAAGPVAYDPKKVASKLDAAIDRIERALKEG